jgi:hypothetical protein
VYRLPRSPVSSAGSSSAGFAGRGTAGSAGGGGGNTNNSNSNNGTIDDGGTPLFRRKQPGRHRRNGSRDAASSPSAASGSAASGGEKKSLLETIFSSSKRKTSNAAALARTPKLRPAPSPAAVARGVEILHSIFPKWEPASLQIVLEANEFVMEDTITAVLNMEEAEGGADGPTDAASDSIRLLPVKNPLPDDFLRVSPYE